MNNPTEEQIKGFWEWCGFTIKEHYLPESTPTDRITVTGLTAPDGEYLGSYPSIDLNNLFKYAVPKLKETHAIQMRNYVDTNTWEVETIGAMIGYNSSLVKDEDPALALFWAIWEAIKGTK